MLELRKLTLEIHGARPLREIDLTLLRGQSLGVVGESGSGKSLTALSLMGLLPNGSKLGGQATWKGRDLLCLTEAQYREIRGREIAMIFQDPMSSLNPSYTVGFQIEEVLKFKMGMRQASERRSRGLQLLKEVGIPAPEERWNSYPHQLSGGMSQRVSIAMALASQPELLIADEPTTALDVTVQSQILELLRKLIRERQMSMIFVTHDLAVAAKVCDFISVFYAGVAVEQGPAKRVLESPRHPYTKALLAARPSKIDADKGGRRPRLAAIPGNVPRSTEQIVGCVFASRCEKVMEICRETRPPMVKSVDGQSSRCFLEGAQ